MYHGLEGNENPLKICLLHEFLSTELQSSFKNVHNFPSSVRILSAVSVCESIFEIRQLISAVRSEAEGEVVLAVEQISK